MGNMSVRIYRPDADGVLQLVETIPHEKVVRASLKAAMGGHEKTWWRVCSVCGDDYEARTNVSKYCDLCRPAMYHKDIRKQRCLRCRRWLPEIRQRSKRYCSEWCRTRIGGSR